MKHSIHTLLAIGLALAPAAGAAQTTAKDHQQHAMPATANNRGIALSTPGRKAASQEIVVAADGSINVLWVETMSAEAVMSEHNVRAMNTGKPSEHGDHAQHGAAPTTVKIGNDVMFARSTDGGRTFSKAVRVNNEPGEVRGVNGNKPRLAIDAKGTIHISWVAAAQTADGFALDIRYANSSNSGKSFTASRTINTHQKPTDPTTGMGNTHAFVGMNLTPKGALHFFWIDTRFMKDPTGSAAMYSTSSLDGGKTFTKEREIYNTAICGCCQIDALTAADGTMYLSWRKVYANNARETVVAHSSDNGKTWSTPVRLSEKDWIIAGCPHKPSALALDKEGRLFVTWYTEAEKPRGVYYAMSADKGKTFSAPMLMHTEAALSDHPELTVGRDGTVYAIWNSRVGEARKLFMRTSRDHGKTFAPAVALDAPDGADYPVIEAIAEGRLLVAWQQGGQIFFRAYGELTAQR